MIDPEVLKAANDYLERSPNSRAAKAIRLMIKAGAVTTGDLNELGYEHPPRAIADVRDLGFPVRTEMVRTPDGKRMARYVFGDAAEIRAGQVGRTNFSKTFRAALQVAYGNQDAIIGAEHAPRVLQIDHRVPYRVGGDAGLKTSDVSAFMLLDPKSQRAKSWACEHCENFTRLLDASICLKCFWAYPDDYSHVAMVETRRVDVVWQGSEASDYDALAARATSEATTVGSLLKALGSEAVKRRK